MSTYGDSPPNSNACVPQQAQISIADVYNLVPEFDGTPQDLDKFLACGNLLFSSTESTPQQKLFLDIIKTKLRGPAFEVIQYKPLTTWNSLAQELRASFREEKSRANAQNELVSIRQNARENVKEYGDRVIQALSLLNSATYTNVTDTNVREFLIKENAKLAIQTFEDGLRNHSLKILVKAHGEKDLRKAVNYALEHSTRLERNFFTPVYTPKPSPRGSVFCTNCNREGHTRDNCYRNSNIPNFPPRVIKREVNHLICAYCKKPNHHINECRTRRRNNGQTLQSRGPQQERRAYTPKPNFNTSTPHNLHYVPTKNSNVNRTPRNGKLNFEGETQRQGNGSPREEEIGVSSRMVHIAEIHDPPNN